MMGPVDQLDQWDQVDWWWDQLINRWLTSWSDYFVTGFGWNGTSDLGVDWLPETKKMFLKTKRMNVPNFRFKEFKYRNSREEVLPSDMGSKMRVVIASRGSGLPTDATDVRLFPGVHLRREEWFFVFPSFATVTRFLHHPIIICYGLPWDGPSDSNFWRTSYDSARTRNSYDKKNTSSVFVFVTSDQKPSAHATDLSPGSRVLCHVPLPIALDGELEAALVADERFHPPVRSHVLLQQSFAQVRLWEKCENIRSQHDSIKLWHLIGGAGMNGRNGLTGELLAPGGCFDVGWS